ncbi:MAG: hypothetical protein LBK53_03025 [Heliobacteriaceae bacterium]|jgi:hypothetical protein|nr:hypothetical protein [Heliobacteriaceae bacterium]
MKISFNTSPAFKALYISDDLRKNATEQERAAILKIDKTCQKLDWYLSKCAKIEGSEIKTYYKLENVGGINPLYFLPENHLINE